MQTNHNTALEAFCHRYLSLVTEITLKDLNLDQLKQDNPALYIQLALQIETFRRQNWDKHRSQNSVNPFQKQMLLFTSLTSITIVVIIGLVSLVSVWYIGFQAGQKQLINRCKLSNQSSRLHDMTRHNIVFNIRDQGCCNKSRGKI